MKRAIFAAVLVAFFSLPGIAQAQGGSERQQIAAVQSLALGGQPFAGNIATLLTNNPRTASAIVAAARSALAAAGDDQALRDFIAGETAAGFRQAENALRAMGQDEAANYIIAVLNGEAPTVVLTAFNGGGQRGGGGLYPMPFGGGTGGGGGTISPTSQ